MKKSALLIMILMFSINLMAQHSVKVKIGKQMYTVSGDTTKYNFKSAIAKLEKRYKDAAALKIKAISNGEVTNINVAYYEVACFYAKDNRLDLASKYILQSIDEGWKDMAHLEYDSDLKPLRSSVYWSRITPKIDKYYESNNKEVAKMYANDQEPRLSGKLDETVTKADGERRERIKILLNDKKIKTAHDYYKAAMIMHHGNSVEDYELAHQLAVKANKKRNKHHIAPWLVAATKDRYLLKKGEKQWYGTQGLTFKNGKMALDPNTIDIQAVDEKTRADLNAPSLEKLKTYIEAFSKE